MAMRPMPPEEHGDCPFCGERWTSTGQWVFVIRRKDGIGQIYNVLCNHCGARGPDAKSPVDAWRLWDHLEGGHR